MNVKVYSAVVMVLIVVSLIFSFPVMAGPTEDAILAISLEEAVDRALGNSNLIFNIENQIDKLWKSHNEAMILKENMQQQLDLLDEYIKLYNKREKGEVLELDEQERFQMLLYIFGPNTPNLSLQDRFNKYIKNRDFPNYSSWAAVQNLINNREVMKLSIQTEIRVLYNNVLSLYEARELQKGLLDNMKKQYAQILVKHESGLVSNTEKHILELSLKGQELTIIKLERSIDNLEMLFKKQLGLPLVQDIKLLYHDQNEKLRDVKEYSSYLNHALEERIEVVTANRNFIVKQRELNIMKEYITDEYNLERQQLQVEFEEAELALKAAVENVTKDIYTGYSDVISKLKAVMLAQSKLNNAELSYKQGKLQYENGEIPFSALSSLEQQLTQLKINLKGELRNYDSAVFKLDMASGLGPQYGVGGE